MLELLKKFASQDDPREYMRGPFTRGEWTYATNGHIAVRVPKIDGVEILPEKHIPNLEAYSNRTAAMPLSPCRGCLRWKSVRFAAEPESLTSARSVAAPARSNAGKKARLPAGAAAELA